MITTPRLPTIVRKRRLGEMGFATLFVKTWLKTLKNLKLIIQENIFILIKNSSLQVRQSLLMQLNGQQDSKLELKEMQNNIGS